MVQAGCWESTRAAKNRDHMHTGAQAPKHHLHPSRQHDARTSIPMVCFVSLISRTDQPLYIQLFLPESTDAANANEFLKFNFLSHMALDVFSSPALVTLREQQQLHTKTGVPPIFLLLLVQDDVSVYGYETNNGLKIIVGLAKPPATARLNELLLTIHKCYLRAICNPFNAVGDDVDKSIENSPTFDRRLKEVVKAWEDAEADSTEPAGI